MSMKISCWIAAFFLGVIILLSAVDLPPYLSTTEEMKIAETVLTPEKAETVSQRLASSKQSSFFQIEEYGPPSQEIESKPLLTLAQQALLSIDKRRPIQTPQSMQTQLTPLFDKNVFLKQQIEMAPDIGTKTEQQPAPAQEQKPAETETTTLKAVPETVEMDQTESKSRQTDSFAGDIAEKEPESSSTKESPAPEPVQQEVKEPVKPVVSAETERAEIQPIPLSDTRSQTYMRIETTELTDYPFSILLGAFQNLEVVKNAQKAYRDKGIFAYWVKVNLGKKGILYRLFAGSFRFWVEAESFQRQHNLTDKNIEPTRYAALIGIFSSETDFNNHLQILLEMNYSPYVISRAVNHHYLYVGAFYTKAGAIDQCFELNKNEVPLSCQAVIRSSVPQSAMVSIAFTDSSKTPQKRNYPYSILLGTYSTMEQLTESLRKYKNLGLQAYWVKIDLGLKRVFFRLFAGQFTARNDAVDFLRDQELPEAQIKLTRYACLAGTFTSKSEVDYASDPIIKKGYHPYSIQLSDNQYRLYAGTFYTQIGAYNFSQELAANGLKCEAVER